MHNENHQEGNFFTGMIMGCVLGAGAVYLTMTKEGRKIAHALLNAAEELGEKGEVYYQELVSETEKTAVKDKDTGSKVKIKTLMEKLKK
ncbi:MAG: YtxH domain-containing protein [Patescibacteria group bacterium]|jgi:gas vesicle protein